VPTLHARWPECKSSDILSVIFPAWYNCRVYKIGLLSRDNRQQVPFAYHMYSRKNKKSMDASKVFKDAFSLKGVNIEFIGVWYVPCGTSMLSSNTHFWEGKLSVHGDLFLKDCPSRATTKASRTSVMHWHLMNVECMCLEILFSVRYLTCHDQALQAKFLGTSEQEEGEAFLRI
jgi:hypothetical protein